MSDLKYSVVWQKLLGDNEKIEYEFSISNRYRVFGIILWAILSLPLILILGLGVITFLVALFYYGFYVSTTVPFPRIGWSARLGGRSDRAPWTVDLSVPQAWRLALQAEGGL